MIAKHEANTHVRGNKPEWAGHDLRLDPHALPQRVSYQRSKSTRTQSVSGSAIEFILDDKGAVVKCNLACGVPLSMALPSRAFQGVAARTFENEDGSYTVTLELLHSDSELSVPLCVSATIEDAAADWHCWSERLGLPMLVIEEDGRASVVRTGAGMTSRAGSMRRRKFTAVKWRPNFLRRRKSGRLGPVVKISAREIIART